MSAYFLSICRATSISFLHPMLVMTLAACPVLASGPKSPQWEAAEPSVVESRAVICRRPDRLYLPTQPTFVITHGMGGTEAGDRFHQLVDAICDAMPEANVLIVDWSKQSWRTRGYLQIPSPWDVAQNIDPVATEAVESLKAPHIQPARITFIGESFGNCANARIAEALGGRGRILAFNPPNDLSGYKTPDLRFCSDVAWSFQTYSLCDSQSPIADLGLFLETRANAQAKEQAKEQHVFGIAWLAARVQSGDLTWLFPELVLPEPANEDFDAVVTISARLLPFFEVELPGIRSSQKELPAGSVWVITDQTIPEQGSSDDQVTTCDGKSHRRRCNRPRKSQGITLNSQTTRARFADECRQSSVAACR